MWYWKRSKINSRTCPKNVENLTLSLEKVGYCISDSGVIGSLKVILYGLIT
jgi:hypothetical protein